MDRFETNAVSRRMSVLAFLLFGGCAAVPATESPRVTIDQVSAGVRVIQPDALAFVPLNPARGDASPQAGVLWGDIRRDVASGVILKFADGFSSPPHIHNITYRAMVISGHVHNDDPDAAPMWMGPGSYWMQPAGEVHITAARPGAPGVSFLEILAGPYLVRPSAQAFDNGEQPLNLAADNIVWMSATGRPILAAPDSADRLTGISLAPLWGEALPGRTVAFALKMAPGARSVLGGISGGLKAVVINGSLTHRADGLTQDVLLEPGGHFASDDARVFHRARCEGSKDCVVYVRADGSALTQ